MRPVLTLATLISILSLGLAAPALAQFAPTSSSDTVTIEPPPDQDAPETTGSGGTR